MRGVHEVLLVEPIAGGVVLAEEGLSVLVEFDSTVEMFIFRD